MQTANGRGPAVWLVGDVEHPDFAASLVLVRSAAIVGPGPPEFIVVAQSRPGTIGEREVMQLRRSAPLAEVISLCGSWCEGESRTGRPLAGANRLYWYEFPDWWRRQLALRSAGLCPEWRQLGDCGLRIADCGLIDGGRVAVATEWWDAFKAIEEVLQMAGWEAIWNRTSRGAETIGSVRCGIWDGGQLSDAEQQSLAGFVGRLSAAGAPVVALLDFPRGDRCELAWRVGVAGILGKPWRNLDLLENVRQVSRPASVSFEPQLPAA